MLEKRVWIKQIFTRTDSGMVVSDGHPGEKQINMVTYLADAAGDQNYEF